MGKVKFEVAKSDDGLWTVHCKGEGIFQSTRKTEAEKIRKLIQRKYDIKEELEAVNEELHHTRIFSPGWLGGW